MARYLLDSSCMVAALSGWHEHHPPVLDELLRRDARGDALVLAAHSLAETYAVLTRLPRPRRLTPADALRLLEDSFIARAEIVTLSSDAYVSLLRRAPASGVAGGRVYDAIIAECAKVGRVEALVTLNGDHFAALLPAGISLVVPG